jgi:hypothetical protein
MSSTPDEAMARFVCVDCSANTCDLNEYYMVQDHVWGVEAGMQPGGGMLYIGCLEQRIGRTLGPSDFTGAPANFIFKQSERLASRRRKEAA